MRRYGALAGRNGIISRTWSVNLSIGNEEEEEEEEEETEERMKNIDDEAVPFPFPPLSLPSVSICCFCFNDVATLEWPESAAPHLHNWLPLTERERPSPDLHNDACPRANPRGIIGPTPGDGQDETRWMGPVRPQRSHRRTWNGNGNGVGMARSAATFLASHPMVTNGNNESIIRSIDSSFFSPGGDMNYWSWLGAIGNSDNK